MTRINTNVSSLVAQKTLARSNNQLQNALTRLSTGLRINVGKDDPAGLIASETLRSDIISVEKAIVNSERANQLIATADSALGQVSSLLNDIRGLVSEAANAGALSDEQIVANQLQVDSSLEAIDRIAQVTSFQGQKLLDGSLDFTTSGVDTASIEGLRIDQANFGTQTSIGVSVNVVDQATKAGLTYAFGAIADSTVLEVGGSNGTEAFQFAAGSTIQEIATAVNLVSDATGVTASIATAAAAGSATLSSFGANNDITLTAKTAGFAAGDVRVKYSEGSATSTGVTFTAASGTNPATIDVALQTQAHVAATGEVDDAIALSSSRVSLANTGSNTFLIDDATGDVTTNVVVLSADLGASAAATATFAQDAFGGDTITITRNTNATTPDNTFATVNTLVTALDGGSRFSVTFGGGGSGASTFDQNIASSDFNAVVVATSTQSVQNAGANTIAVTDSTGANDTKIEIVSSDLGASADATVGLVKDAAGDVITITFNSNASPGNNTFGAAETLIEALDGGSRFVATIGGGGTTASLFDQVDALNTFSGGTESTNNAIDVTARFTGADFNGVTVNLVNDALRNFTGIAAGSETLEYSADAKAAVGIIDFGQANTDLIITADTAGAASNEVSFVTTNTNGSGGATTATYNSTTKVLTLGFDYSDATVAVSAIKSAINGTGVFTATDGNSSTGAGNVDGTSTANQGTLGNTGFSGGDAKTVFVFIDQGRTTANQIQTAIDTNTDLQSARVAELFGFNNTTDSDGTGRVRAQSFSSALGSGVTGGAVIATANDLVAAINADASAGAVVTAALSSTDNGFAVVSTFQESAFTGGVASSNRLQFLSPENGPNIRFTSTTGTSLSLDRTTDPRTEGFGAVILQAAAANASLTITARNTGTDFDGYQIILTDDANVTAGSEIVKLDKENKTLEFLIDNTNTTADQLRLSLNNDDYASQFFRATNFGTSTGAGNITVADGTSNTASRTLGGLTSAGTLIVNLETDAAGLIQTDANELIAFLDDPSTSLSGTELTQTQTLLNAYGISVSNAEGSTGTGLLTATTADAVFTTSGTALADAQATGTTFSVNGTNAQLTFTTVTAGATFDNVSVVFQANASITQGNETGAYDATSKTLTFQIDDGNTTAANIASIFTSGSGNFDATLDALFNATASGSGAGVITNLDSVSLTGGVTDTGTKDGATLLGNSDAAASGLTFQSSKFGSDEFVSLKALSGSFAVTDSAGASATRTLGSDVNARINGIQAIGKGLQASINTSSLDLTFSLNSSVTDGSQFSFNITGGGALFQLGPDVVSNQQARLGVQSVSTATLGGVNGRLFELRSGGAKAVDKDTGGAAKIVDEVVTVVTQLRGRLGAFQKTTLETNIFTLSDTLANLTDAESSIRDADFAKESAKLTRAQILVQSGISVLSIANSNPQSVLSLLR